MDFVEVEPGEFVMGCSDTEVRCSDDERPAHVVRITGAFAIGKYEVTQAQWVAVMGTNPSQIQGPRLPVENVSWHASREFLARLGRADRAWRYRLPTEAEWEYAARAGSREGLVTAMDDIAWHPGNSGNRTHAVGTRQPNAWGIHDMIGNVWEWCSDWYEAGYYARSPEADPQGPDTGEFRVMRGGSWYRYHWFLRLSARFREWPRASYRHVGFRSVRVRR